MQQVSAVRSFMRWVLLAGCAALLSLAVAAQETGHAGPPVDAAEPPPTLQETGLYSDLGARVVDPAHLYFVPQYPLWTDGATKRRWMSLPPGSVIDGSDPDAWVFPVGTRFWKEFSLEGRPVETRFMELQANGEWLYASYEWSPDGAEATLAPVRGRGNAAPLEGGRSYVIPSVSDCGVCHRSRSTEVLGFGALQLSPERDPGALHVGHDLSEGIDLNGLMAQGLIVGLPSSFAEVPPHIEARSPTERAALGYLHGNCGHCHNATGKLTDLDLILSQSVKSPELSAVATTVGQPIQDLPPGLPPEVNARIAPGEPDQSGLLQRMASRHAALQMPPLGTQLVDDEAVDLLRQWISELPMNADEATEATTEEDNQ